MEYGRYQIETRLAKGSMGILYQAYDPQIDRMVALKVLRRDRLSSEEFVQRFLKEAKAIGRLSHPNIVTVFDFGRDQENIYIAMELVEGKPLDIVIREGELSLKETVVFGIHVAEALNYAHQKGVVHRDIKPSNIIVSPDSGVKITDFGIARFENFAETDETQAGVVLGTPLYMSPEQISGQPVDARTDLYSLGAVLYELTTGRCPFKGKGLGELFRSIAQDTPEFPTKVDSTLGLEPTQDLYKLIMQSLSKDPGERFQTGEDMAKALIACLRTADFAEVKPPQLQKNSSRFSSYVAGVVILLSVLSALIAIFWPDSNQFLSVESAPAGAQVFVDGAFQGKTPLRLSLSIGKHEVRLSLAQYLEWEAQVDINEGKHESLAIPLIPMNETFQ